MQRKAILLLPTLLLAVGQLGCVGDATSRLTKADAQALLEDEPADSSWDPCAEEGWYADGICDDWCPAPDPECMAPPPGERPCGGLAGLTCTDHEYCDYPADAFCGAADQTGVCRPRPDAWIEIYAPVCGCDGRTYSNEGEAHGSGTDVAHTGACDDPTVPPPPPPPPPGDGRCGGFAGFACEADEWCDFEDGDFCGAADALGTCRPRPDSWIEIYAPVCGCDGRTYSNEGEANGNGTDIAHRGTCEDPTEPPPPPPPPPPGAGHCGGFAGFACNPNEFCDYEAGDLCGAADALGTCRPRPEVCPEIWAPVCGCDGVTYSSACDAQSRGIDDAAPGECAHS